MSASKKIAVLRLTKENLQHRIDLRDRAVRRAGFKWALREDGEFELVRDLEKWGVTVKEDK